MNRRKFLKKLSVTGCAVGAASAPFFLRAKETAETGAVVATKEIEKLKKDYEKLDNKVKLMMKLLFASSGLDIFLSL